MARREYRASFKCAEPGCRDTQFFAVSTRADETALYKQQKAYPYRCTRHADKDANLRPGNERTRHVVIASRIRSHLPDVYPYNLKPPEEREWLKGLFWVREGAASTAGSSGFEFGPGFTAHASDFPEGTRLVVTAQIELPTDPERGQTSPATAGED